MTEIHPNLAYPEYSDDEFEHIGLNSVEFKQRTTNPRYELEDDPFKDFDSSVFGASVLQMWNPNRDPNSPVNDMFNRQLDRARSQLEDGLYELDNKLFVFGVGELPVPPELLAKLGCDTESDDFIENGANRLNALIDSDAETFVDFLAWNKDRLESFGRENETLLQEIVGDFRTLMVKGIEMSGLPLSVDELDKRLASARFVFADLFTLGMGDAGGRYSPDTRTIYIGAYSDQQVVRGIVYHELLHHVNGQLVIEEQLLDSADGAVISITHQTRRAGLESAKHMKWINEAITEQLAQYLLSGSMPDLQTVSSTDFFTYQNGVYNEERSVAGTTFEDVPMSLVLAAYFEDYIPENGAGKRSPKHRELSLVLGEDFGRGMIKARNGHAFIEKLKSPDNFLLKLLDDTFTEEDFKPLSPPKPRRLTEKQKIDIAKNKALIKKLRADQSDQNHT